MDSFCGKILTSMFILPFTAGNYRRRPNGSWCFDCTIASRVLFLIVLATIIVLTASKDIHKHADVRLAIVVILLSLSMCAGVIGIYILGCFVKYHGQQYIVASTRNTHTSKLQVIFLWGFGLASGIRCILSAGKHIECTAKASHSAYWTSMFCFYTLVIVYLFSEMIFITYCSTFKLKKTLFVNYVMLMLLTANVSVIVYIHFLHDTFSYFTKNDNDGQLSSCLLNNSTISHLMTKSQPFLYPASVEYSLLSITILLEIWSPTKLRHVVNEQITSPQELESVPLVADDTSIEDMNSENRSGKTVCQMATLAGSLSAGIGLILCNVILATGIGENEYVRYVAGIYEFTLNGMMSLAIFAGFYCLVKCCTPDSVPKGLGSREYVYLLSAFGLFMTNIAEGIGNDVSTQPEARLFMYRSIFSVFQDYLQVVFLLLANRCKKVDPRSNIHPLESALIFIMISNFVLWFNDSVLLSKFPNTRSLHYQTDNTTYTMYEDLLPVAVFFRFTSFMEYYTTFGKYTS
ncbi:proton channel OtopLc-like [Argopecten irradians]|uniref:proton channel OtopLc-like n=1 Tax=Argopecten irradians TaxID=31199 RepID=UPI003715B2DE